MEKKDKEKEIEKLPSPIKLDVMTTYDTLIKQGMEKGMEKGLERGVINLHKKDFTIPEIADIMEISIEKVKEILKRNGLV